MPNLRWKKDSIRSKSQEKDVKYISAAIMPSAAFIVNPTISSEFSNIDGTQNNLLTSTLNSSLLGLSQESIDKDEVPKEKKTKSLKLRKKNSITKSQENLQTNADNFFSIRGRKKAKDTSLKKPPIQANSNKETKRHIEIANGLYDDVKSNEISRSEIPSDESDAVYSVPNRKETIKIKKRKEQELEEENSKKSIKFDKKNTIIADVPMSELHEIPQVHSDNELSDKNEKVENFFQSPVDNYDTAYNKSRSYTNDILIHEIDSDAENNKNFLKIGFEPLDDGIRNREENIIQQKTHSVGFKDEFERNNNISPQKFNSKILEYEIQQNSEQNIIESDYEVIPKRNIQTKLSIGFEEQVKEINNKNSKKSTMIIPNHPQHPSSSNNMQKHHLPHHPVDLSISEKTEIINNAMESKSSIKQMKKEISLLQDTIYRLNMELSSRIPVDEPGRSIGKTIFPGKGPVPSWLMNTKYLAPLFVFHDKKYQQQSHKIEQCKVEIENFEKEIRQIIKENERLHLKLQENQKGGPLSNKTDWQVIVQQAKLVIEENHLLLEELDLQQKKFNVCENNNLLEVAKLKKSLVSVSSERDALNEEIQNLTRRLAGVKGSTVQLSSLNQENGDIYHLGSSNGNIYPSQLKVQDILIDELKNDKRKLEQEIESLKQNGLKQEKEILKFRKKVESDQKFREYFNEVLEKSDAVVNERNSLSGKFAILNKEISRIIGKLKAEINHRADVDTNNLEIKAFHKDQNDEFLDKLYFIESMMDLVLQHFDDLNMKCKSQENEINKYQLQLKEKDIYIKECQQENDEMEEKLGYLLRNAENDN